MRSCLVIASLLLALPAAQLTAQQPKTKQSKPLPAPKVFGTPMRMHQNFASCIAWSPDGSLVATGGWDGVVQLHEAATGKRLCVFEPGDIVQGVAFCGPGASRLAVKTTEHGLIAYDVKSRKEVGRLAGRFGRIAGFPDGATVAVGTLAGELWLVDAATWQKRDTAKVCEGSVETVSVSPDGSMVVCNELLSRTGHLYDVMGKKVVNSVKWGSLATEQLFEPDGKAMLVVSSRMARRITVPAGEETDRWQLGSTTLCATLSKDGKQLFLGDDEGAVLHVDLEAGKVGARSNEHMDAVKDLELSPDGATLVSVSQDQTVRFWRVPTLDELHLSPGHNGMVRSVAVAADGKSLLSASLDNSVIQWSRDGKLLNKSTAHAYAATCVVAARDGTWWSSSMDNTIRHFDAKNQETGKVQLEESDAYAQCFVLDDAGSTLVSGHVDGSVRWFDAATGEMKRKAVAHEGRVLAVCVAGDGTFAASAGEDGKLVVWDLAKGEPKHSVAAHEGGVSGLVRLPDGALVTSGYNRELKRWDPASGTVVTKVMVGDKDESAVGALAWLAPQGQLVTASADAIRLFEPKALSQAGSLGAPPTVPTSTAASADGTVLLTGLVDGTLAVWTLPAPVPAKAPAKKPGK